MHSLNRRIALLSASVLITYLLIASFIIISIVRIRQQVQELGEPIVKESLAQHRLLEDLDQAQNEARLYALTDDVAEREQALEFYDDAQASLAFLQNTTAFVGLTPEQENERNQLLTSYQEKINEFGTNINAIIAARDQDDQAQIDRLLDAAEDKELDLDLIDEQSATFIDDLATRSTNHVDRVLRETIMGISIAMILILVIVGGLFVGFRWQVLKPIQQIAQTSQHVAAGNITERMPISSVQEFAQVQTAFNTMLDTLTTQQATVEEQNHSLEASLAKQQKLFQTVKQLGTPLLPITHDALVVPLIGHLDVERMQDIAATIRLGIVQRRVKRLLIDLTGVAALDETSCLALNQMIQSAKLLGAQPILVGISAHVALALSQQNHRFGAVAVYGTLEQALHDDGVVESRQS